MNPTGFGEWRTIIFEQTSDYFVYSLYEAARPALGTPKSSPTAP